MEKQKTTLYKQLTNEAANTFLFWALNIGIVAGFGYWIFGRMVEWQDTKSPIMISLGCLFIQAVNVGATYFNKADREARK